MPRAPDLTGCILEGRYELHALIGEGTFGRVYRGRDRRLERAVAVKVIKPWWAEEPVWVERFAQETRLLARLSDPGIVQIYDVGEAAEGLFYVAELVDGPSLADRLRRGRMSPGRAATVAGQLAAALARAHEEGIVQIYDVGEAAEGLFYVAELVDGPSLADRLRRGRMSPGRAATVAGQLAAALARAHEQGIVHRDVKPANILLGRDGVLKVGDFGVARLTQGGSNGASATVIGTPQYMSPEQARGERTTPASDVYGAGVVLYEMLAGRPPFAGEAAVLIALHHLRDPPPPLPEDVPQSLREVVECALAKDPARRYADGGAMAGALAIAAIPGSGDSRRHRPRTPVMSGVTVAASRGVTVAASPDDAPAAAAPATAPTQGMPPPRVAAALAAARAAAPTAVSPRGRASWTPGTLRLAPPTPPASPPRRWRSRVGPALLGLALAVGVVLIVPALGGASLTRVPHVLGMRRAAILSLARRDHLRPSFRAAFASAARGTAVGQRPAAGSKVGQHTTLSVLLSAGPPPVAVPALLGHSTADARAHLRALRLTASVTPVPAPGVAAGIVTGQQPRPPATLATGASVALQVAEVPRWQAVTTFSSTGGGQSVPFRIRGARWQVSYHLTYQDVCTLLFVCFGPHADLRNVGTVASASGFDLSGGEHTQAFTNGPGIYQLHVGGGQDTGAWTMTVQDLY